MQCISVYVFVYHSVSMPGSVPVTGIVLQSRIACHNVPISLLLVDHTVTESACDTVWVATMIVTLDWIEL